MTNLDNATDGTPPHHISHLWRMLDARLGIEPYPIRSFWIPRGSWDPSGFQMNYTNEFREIPADCNFTCEFRPALDCNPGMAKVSLYIGRRIDGSFRYYKMMSQEPDLALLHNIRLVCERSEEPFLDTTHRWLEFGDEEMLYCSKNFFEPQGIGLYESLSGWYFDKMELMTKLSAS